MGDPVDEMRRRMRRTAGLCPTHGIERDPGCEDCATPECDGSGWVGTEEFFDGRYLEPVKCPGCRRCDPCPTCNGSGYDTSTSVPGYKRFMLCRECNATGRRKP